VTKKIKKKEVLKEMKKKEVLKEMKKKEYPSTKFSAKKKKDLYQIPPLNIMQELQKIYALF